MHPAIRNDGKRASRRVRSFVRRAGRLTPSQRRALTELWPEYGVEFESAPLDLDAIFGRRAPRILEIGFGNGETLIEQAHGQPAADFLGVEVHEPGLGHCLLAAKKAEVHNVRLIAHDALEVLDGQIPHGSLARINLYFPDPWPKKRHHKRRIVQQSFLEQCADALEPRGSLHIATDWANYAEHIDNALFESPRFAVSERREHDGERPLDRPQTKFERRGLRRGHRIHDWRAERCG